MHMPRLRELFDDDDEWAMTEAEWEARDRAWGPERPDPPAEPSHEDTMPDVREGPWRT